MDTRRKNSIKRQAILDALLKTKEHPSAEMLYNRLKPEIRDLSLGTVYRNLSMFCEEGLARNLGKVEGKERFDGRTDQHSHFICRSCRKIFDLDVSPVSEELLRSIRTEYGFIPENFHLSFTGLCRDCGSRA